MAEQNGRPTLPPVSSNFPGQMRDLIVQCWDANPEKRPTFASIAATQSIVCVRLYEEGKCLSASTASFEELRGESEVRASQRLRGWRHVGAKWTNLQNLFANLAPIWHQLGANLTPLSIIGGL